LSGSATSTGSFGRLEVAGVVNASGNTRVDRLEIDGATDYIDTSSGNLFIVTTGDIAAQAGTGKALKVTGGIEASSHITASGDVYVSGNISGSSSSTGSFGMLQVRSGSTTGGTITTTEAGKVGIGTSSPDAKLEVLWGAAAGSDATILIGADSGASTATDNTQKQSLIAHRKYDNDEEHFIMFYGEGGNGENRIAIGGGLGTYTAATNIRFHTAANDNTAAGTEAMRIDSSQNVLFQTANQKISGSASSTVSAGTGSFRRIEVPQNTGVLNLQGTSPLLIGDVPYEARIAYNVNGNLDITARSSYNVDIVHGDLILTEGGINVKDDNVKITGSLYTTGEVRGGHIRVGPSGYIKGYETSNYSYGRNYMKFGSSVDMYTASDLHSYQWFNYSNTSTPQMSLKTGRGSGGELAILTVSGSIITADAANEVISGSKTSTGSFGRVESAGAYYGIGSYSESGYISGSSHEIEIAAQSSGMQSAQIILKGRAPRDAPSPDARPFNIICADCIPLLCAAISIS
jgi:hypothetical protein